MDAVYYDSLLPVATVAEGSFQTLPDGHVLLDYGLQPYMIEYNAAGDVVWTAHWGITGDGSYRGYKTNFTGTPSTAPDLVLKKNLNGSYTAYMSWNGATHYTRWEIQGCGSSGVEIVSRSGFETSFTGSCGSTVLAKALGPAGAVLGESQTVQTDSLMEGE